MKSLTAAFLPLCLASLIGCSTLETQGSEPAPPAQKKKDDDGSEKRSLEHKLEVATLRMKQAKMEADTATEKTRVALDLAREELTLAEGKLAQFRDVDMPNSIAKTELSLKRAMDSTQEAAEELKQLEIMYNEQDLEDMTSEFVINRGKRRAERAQLSLAIQQSEFASLKDHSMPRELLSRELDVIRKTSAVRSAEADSKASELKHKIALLKAEFELAELQEKLDKLAEKGGE